MAKKKKTRAEQIETASQSKKKNKINKPEKEKKEEQPKRQMPVRVISSLVFLVSFIIMLIMFFTDDGVFTNLIANFVRGLIGQIGFAIMIPALLYAFIIHAFSGERPIIMRTICLFCFVFICSCLYHLAVDSATWTWGGQLFRGLYLGGISGATGGLLCGGVTLIFKWLMATAICYLVFIVAAILTLLGAMQITIPSIVRAFQDRPRDEEEEEKETAPEPAAVVVNHFADKHLERKRKRRAAIAARQQEQLEEQKQDVLIIPESMDAQPVAGGKNVKESKVSAIMRQIDSDIESPVAVASPVAVEANPIAEPEIISDSFRRIEDDFPENMPELDSQDVHEVKYAPAEMKKAAADAKAEKVTAKQAADSAAEVAEEIAQNQKSEKPVYYFPPIELLKHAGGSTGDATAEMRENSQRLNETLASFKIEAHIINVTRGPSVTRYEVELEKGVRLNKLTTAADDIALSLGASGVRIAAVPGKISVVGIEVPNRAVTTVSLREVIDSQDFHKAKSLSSFAVGKDIGGNCIVGNIAKLPHMLIAGTTGSGKSVCMNSIIISLLYKASPDDVKLIMVDPKMVELGIYNGIPHLLIPVVTDPKKAAGSLQWAVAEMMRRYKAMSDVGVRDLESYNSIMESQETDGHKLPQVVVIIDELADLMLVAAKEVEESICRIAQMGRAAGIHLIIATQRPSADVITGLMKANIPSRIAFAVASAMESRIILDTQGAEKLVGRGDMLYAPIGSGKPKRVQGCFVSDPEVEAVATYVKSKFSTDYDQDIMEEIDRKAAQTGNKTAAATASDPEPNSDELDGDEMLPQAVDVILETKQASVSMLQRRLKLGYARAARIVDEMEEKGIVGPFQGSKPREILITKEQWETMKQGKPAQMDFDDLVEEDEGIEDFEEF